MTYDGPTHVGRSNKEIADKGRLEEKMVAGLVGDRQTSDSRGLEKEVSNQGGKERCYEVHLRLNYLARNPLAALLPAARSH